MDFEAETLEGFPTFFSRSWKLNISVINSYILVCKIPDSREILISIVGFIAIRWDEQKVE